MRSVSVQASVQPTDTINSGCNFGGACGPPNQAAWAHVPGLEERAPAGPSGPAGPGDDDDEEEGDEELDVVHLVTDSSYGILEHTSSGRAEYLRQQLEAMRMQGPSGLYGTEGPVTELGCDSGGSGAVPYPPPSSESFAPPYNAQDSPAGSTDLSTSRTPRGPSAGPVGPNGNDGPHASGGQIASSRASRTTRSRIASHRGFRTVE